MDGVTSLAEVWIETKSDKSLLQKSIVTSLAEVWIETKVDLKCKKHPVSLPLRKCGLKLPEEEY